MTNLRIKSGILFISVLLFVLAGCKKGDDTTVFTIVGDTSLHFSFGQQKKISYTARNVRGFNAPTTPAGWTCNVGNGIITITAPSESDSGASLSGYITIKYISSSGGELSKEIAVAVKTAEKIASHANCHIVRQPNQRYKFDARIKGNETSATMSPDGAVLVWSSPKEAVGHVSLEDGYLFFATDDTSSLVEANAVLAVVDSNDNIIWSWHIWATDYDPEAEAHSIAEGLLMNRNLGASGSSNGSSDEAFQSYGLYYQWGRKDPFVGPNAWNTTSQKNIYGPSSKVITISFEKTTSTIGTIAYATANPTLFITGAEETGFDWLFSARNNDLWGAVSGTKTVYDPCPSGWKVAPASIWEGYTTTGAASKNPDEFNVFGEYEYGWTFTDTRGGHNAEIYYAAAGRRSFSPTLGTYAQNYTNIISNSPVGFYWSNSNGSAGKSLSLAFEKEYVNPGVENISAPAEWSRAGAFPLRCIKE